MTGHQADFIGALPGAQNLEDLDATCFSLESSSAPKRNDSLIANSSGYNNFRDGPWLT